MPRLSDLNDEEILISDKKLIYPAAVIKQAVMVNAGWLIGQNWWVMTVVGMEPELEQPVEIDAQA